MKSNKCEVHIVLLGRCQSVHGDGSIDHTTREPRAASTGHWGVDRIKSRQNMVRTVIEMWRAIRETETNNGKHNWRDSSIFHSKLLVQCRVHMIMK